MQIAFFAVVLAVLATSAYSFVHTSTKSHNHIQRNVLQMSKTIAVFGGTGATGRECVYQALNQGYNVVTLARDPSRMLNPDRIGGAAALGKLQVITGNVCDAGDVEKVYSLIESKGDEVVGTIVALGGKTKNVGPTMLTDGTRNIIQAMKTKKGSHPFTHSRIMNSRKTSLVVLLYHILSHLFFSSSFPPRTHPIESGGKRIAVVTSIGAGDPLSC